MKSLLALLVFLALVAAAALTGMMYLPGPWYEALVKPEWTPPNWLFPPVWTVLYVMIALAGWRVWEKQGFNQALLIWLVSLQLNAAWSVFMFKEHQIGMAAPLSR
jgi:tryptophan-rich sensory protein